MLKLVETKLQKFILFIGGILILLRLWEVSYYERYTAILTSIGILIFTIVLLIILRDYHPKFHLRIIAFLKRRKRVLIFLFLFIFLIILIIGSRNLYSRIKEEKIRKAEEEKFHNAEIAYQKCLDKVSTLTTYKIEYEQFFSETYKNTKEINKYFDEWIEAGRPNYNPDRGHWEWAFMEWMMERYPEFCKEYDIDLINYFLKKKEIMILGVPE
jgi:hypothetical protein